jgi:hypothetical protein
VAKALNGTLSCIGMATVIGFLMCCGLLGTCSKPPQPKASEPATSPLVQSPTVTENQFETQATAWLSTARNTCERDGMARSRQIAESTGLDVEFPWLGFQTVIADMDKDFAYVQFQREYKVTIFGTRLKKTMLINYRCWGEPVQCEYLRHGSD